MNQVKIQSAAQTIMVANLEFLAKLHGVTSERIRQEILAGSIKLVEQFKVLAVRGADEAVKLAEEGKISFS